MNFYLLQLVGKWLSVFTLSFMSFVGLAAEEKNFEVTNDNINKNISVVTEVVSYETIKTYDDSIPSNQTKVIQAGKDGVITYDSAGNAIILEEMIAEQIVVGTGAQSEYTGIITGYGPDCYTCSGIGNVACRTEDKRTFNLINDGIYYEDDEYGSVRVLAAALTKFPCGTIIKISHQRLGEFVGIVLDTGYDMRKALENGVNHIDVAFTTEKDQNIYSVTDKSGNVKYSVQRWGW